MSIEIEKPDFEITIEGNKFLDEEEEESYEEFQIRNKAVIDARKKKELKRLILAGILSLPIGILIMLTIGYLIIYFGYEMTNIKSFIVGGISGSGAVILMEFMLTSWIYAEE